MWQMKPPYRRAARWQSTAIEYSVEIDSDAEPTELDMLLRRVDAVAEIRTEVPFEKLLGQKVTVKIHPKAGDRFFNGIVTYFGKIGLSMNHTRYVAVLNPKLTLFDYARDCRVAVRDIGYPDYAFSFLGFRVVLPPGQ